MAKNTTLISMLNSIRAAASPTYQERVPVATQENISSVGNPLIEYTPLMNEFLSLLVNRISLVVVRNRELHNPLAILKQGENPLGQDIEEIAINPAKAETYNPNSLDLLKQSPPDVKATYHRLNRKDVYSVTLSRERIKLAFTSWEKLDELVSGIVNSLYSGNYLDEFLLTKRLFASAIQADKINTETIAPVTDEQSAKDFITVARTYFTNFGIPSSNYNSWLKSGGTGNPYVTWTPPESIRMILRSDIESFVSVNVLAAAFNMNKADFLGKVLITDNFDTAENCLAIMFDKAFPQIYDNTTELTEFFNAQTLNWNYYLHKWQTWSVSPFANAVAFVTSST